MGIIVRIRDRMQYLSYAGVGFDGLKDVDGGGADARIGIVEQGFKDGIADADVLSDPGFEALKGFFADAFVFIVAKGDHEGVADAGGLATVSGAALGSHEADGSVADAGGG